MKQHMAVSDVGMGPINEGLYKLDDRRDVFGDARL